ncbi:MAG: hypothetical protein ABI634_01135 [Acidobacteriota bacterium]
MTLVRGMFLSLVALFLAIATAQPALAQQTYKAKKESNGIGIGVEGMLTFPNISNLSNGFKAKTGSGFGLWIGGNKNGLIGFTGEFIYATSTIESTDGLSAVKRRSLEIPEVFHINFGSRSKNGVSGYVVIGSVTTIKLKDSLSGGLTGLNFNGVDYGLMGGLGMEAYRVGVEVRGNWGLKTITTTDGGAFQDSKTHSIEVLGKFRFN